MGFNIFKAAGLQRPLGLRIYCRWLAIQLVKLELKKQSFY
jgi:hypothetical protein